jgi:hypothetical protein
MADTGDYGLMLWEGKSKGTVNNVVKLSRDHKPVVVYVASTGRFRTIKDFDDVEDLPRRRFGQRETNRQRAAPECCAATRRRVTCWLAAQS